MSNTRDILAYLRDATRYPKVQVTPLSVPTVQVTNEEWNKALELMNGHESLIDRNADLLSDRTLNVNKVGFDGTTKSGHIMVLDDGDVVWNEAGNSLNLCATMPVASGDVIYLSSYPIGGYQALPWAIVNSQGTVLQHADANVDAGDNTPEYRIVSGANAMLYVYMQTNVGMPTIRRVTENNAKVAEVAKSVENVATFSTTPATPTVQDSCYITNAALERGYAVDTVESGGNANNGVYSIQVQKGGVYRIENAGLGGYGSLFWTLINSEGIIQHQEGTNNTLASPSTLVAEADGTLYVSFGYYDSTAEEYVRPSIYKVADLNARHEGVSASLKSICKNSLLREANVTKVTGHYLSVEDGELSTPSGGNTNNGYLSLSLNKGDYVKVTGACSSSYSNLSWVLADGNGNVLQWSGHIGYNQETDDFDFVVDADSTLYIGFGRYDQTSETYPVGTAYVIADSGKMIENHDASIADIDRALYKKYVPFAGFEAPMIIRYGSGTTLKLDTDYGNDNFRCYHVSVTAGEKYLVHGASVGAYDGVAWAIFDGQGHALQQSSTDTFYRQVFADSIIEVEKSGTLYVGNYREEDDQECAIYKIDSEELDGNPKTKPIVICGDSTSQGLASRFDASLLKNPRRVFRMGVGSENVYATAARMGAIPCLVMPVTIPAAATAVQVTLTPRTLFKQGYDSDGVPTTPTIQNEYVSPEFVQSAHFFCSIGGVSGDLFTDSEDGLTYFLRDAAGSAVTLLEPTEVVPLAAERVRNSLLVCLMGTNGGFLNYNGDYVADDDLRGDQTDEQRAKNLFDIMKRMFAYMGGEMVIIGFFCGELPTYYTKAFYEKYESLCEHEFGERFINARLWLKDYAWKEMGLTLTSTDKGYMAAGYPPVQLFDAGQAVHLSDDANVEFAKCVATRISNIGY